LPRNKYLCSKCLKCPSPQSTQRAGRKAFFINLNALGGLHGEDFDFLPPKKIYPIPAENPSAARGFLYNEGLWAFYGSPLRWSN
jgi:hypothetical protein